MHADVFGDLKIYMLLRRSLAHISYMYMFFSRYILGSCPPPPHATLYCPKELAITRVHCTTTDNTTTTKISITYRRRVCWWSRCWLHFWREQNRLPERQTPVASLGRKINMMKTFNLYRVTPQKCTLKTPGSAWPGKGPLGPNFIPGQRWPGNQSTWREIWPRAGSVWPHYLSIWLISGSSLTRNGVWPQWTLFRVTADPGVFRVWNAWFSLLWYSKT